MLCSTLASLSCCCCCRVDSNCCSNRRATAAKGVARLIIHHAPEDGAGHEVDLRVSARGLASRGAIIVPVGQVLRLGGHLGQGTGLGAQVCTRSTNPHVFCNDLAALVGDG